MKKQLRVCLVNALFHPFSGGIEKHMFELAKRLAARGVKVHVLTSRLPGTPVHETMHGFEVHRIPTTIVKAPLLYPPPTTITPGVLLALKKLDEKYDFDLFHLHNRWFADWALALCAYSKLSRKPMVISIHNARPSGISTAYTVFGYMYDLPIGQMIFRCADRIIATSEFARQDIAKYGISKNKMFTIHNGVETHDYHPPNAQQRQKARAAFHLAPGDFAFFWVGRVIKQKGLDYLIRGLPEALKKSPNIKIVLVGEGSERKKLEKLAKSLHVDKHVWFAGPRHGPQLLQALNAADAFVLPSLWEVFPIALLEAMSSGLPCVCSDAGGDAEAVRNGKDGFVVPKRDTKALVNAMLKLAQKPSLARKMGRSARKRAVKEFDWKNQADKILAFYKKVIAEKRSR
ncbi:MAG TPA: glycosyltransferase family 4 protein [Candidatus Norongarragalinales archaeon]|jgi:glycosyltransferase involved in cell wall biosynthesis|nr:glycosyltransferase family 4 protein [Candidatus Norongarragalinales archaeon]